MRVLALAVCLLALASCVSARGLLSSKKKDEKKPVYCRGPAPPMANTTWPDTCKDAPLGRECKGQCAQGFRGEPTAVCTKKGWSANGGCKPQTCDTENLPQIANATWDCGLPAPRHHDDDDHEKDDDHEGDDDHEEDDDHQDVLLGTTCTAKCDPLFTESAPITSTCTPPAPGSKKATWSPTTAFCGVIRSQALLTFTATATDGQCTQAATDSTKASVTSYMQSQTGVNELQVSVTCYNADGSLFGGSARRRLQQGTGETRFVVLVVYVGGTQAATALVDTAETNLNDIGSLIDNVAAATNNAITVQQEGTTGDVSGGSTPQQDAKLSLLRSGSGPYLQTATSFFLTAVYTGPSGTVQAGVTITGPTVDQANTVTCTPATPSSTTDALGMASWSCTTGTTPGPVTISASAPNGQGTVSASVSVTIGTDCVGDFGPFGECSNACGRGTYTKVYTISVSAENGGRACPHENGYNVTEACDGPTTCDGNATCSNNICVCSAGFSGDGQTCTQCSAGTWQDGSFAQCQACPDGFTTARPGATSNTSCTNCQTLPTVSGATLVESSCPLPGDYNQVCTATCAAGLTSTVAATCKPTWQVTGCCVPATFDTYAPGSIGPAISAEDYAGQQGWTTTDNFPKSKCRSDGNTANIWDQAVVDVTDGSGNTQRAWRISNAVSTYGFSASPCSYSSCQPAGEGGASPQAALWNDRGPTGCGPAVNNYGYTANAYATSQQFSWSVDFRSALGGPSAAPLHIELASVARQSPWRQTYLRIKDSGAGFDILVSEKNATAGLIYTDEYNSTNVQSRTLTIASGLSYTDTHTLETRVYFVDGIKEVDGFYVGNDIVQVYLNGTLIHTGSTWEAIYLGWQNSNITPPRKQAVDSLQFRTEKPSQAANLGQGFIFSKVVVTNPPALA